MPYDPIKVIAWMKNAIEHKKQKLRSELKSKFLKPWLEATPDEKPEILNKIGEEIPRQHWDALVEYFTKQEKQEEAERNKVNRASMQKPRAHGTSGGRIIVNTNYHLKQKNPDEYNPVIGWIETYRGKDQASISYRVIRLNFQTPILNSYNIVKDLAAGMEVGPDSPLTVIAPILDSISGGHHGGYKRGIGSEGNRRYMTTPVIHDYAMTQTQREATSQTEMKVKQLESSLDVEIRDREEQASMFTAQASKLTTQMAEMERRHQEEQEKSNAQMAEMYRYMSAFFSSSRGTSGS